MAVPGRSQGERRAPCVGRSRDRRGKAAVKHRSLPAAAAKGGRRPPVAPRRGLAFTAAGLALAGILVCAPGCNIVSALFYFFSPPQIRWAEYKLPPGRLAVLIDLAHPEEANPIFARALHERLAEIFRDNRVKAELVPQEDVIRLQQQNADFAEWSVQEVGQRLDAPYVLWLRVERLQLLEAPDSPILHPYVVLRMRLIDSRATPDKVRVWPPAVERDGREVQRARQPREAVDAITFDMESAKLGKDVAWLVAAPFYNVDLEKKTPWEP